MVSHECCTNYFGLSTFWTHNNIVLSAPNVVGESHDQVSPASMRKSGVMSMLKYAIVGVRPSGAVI